MTHSMTAVAALIAAAGFAGAVQAQSMTPTGTSPTQNMQSTQYTGQNPTQPYGGQYNPYAAQQTQPQANSNQWNGAQQPQANPQWNAAQRPSTAGTANRNQAQQNSMQRPATMPPAGMQSRQDEVRQAQQQLAAEGLYRGADDGVIGRQTRRAVARFQRQNGLRVTGSLDEETLSQLNGASPQGYGATAGQPTAQPQPMGTTPTYQAPNTGAYNTNPGSHNRTPGSYNSAGTTQGYQPPQR